jgi:DNA adenine methylase
VISFIKWSGSKRSQAKAIVAAINEIKFHTYFEPFIGSGAILGELSPEHAVGGDIYSPLINLWKEIRDNPAQIAADYQSQWEMLQDRGHLYFYEVRDRFNKYQSPYDLLFLSRTCVNGLIRFNAKGEFNNSLHHSRKGMNPKTLEKIVYDWSKRIQGHEFINGDYRETTRNATENDLVYLDPPYFNNKNRYLENIEYEKFIDYLRDLNQRSVKFILSYDGHTDTKVYTHHIPEDLYKRKILLSSGLSAFRKTQDKASDMVYESLYINF